MFEVNTAILLIVTLIVLVAIGVHIAIALGMTSALGIFMVTGADANAYLSIAWMLASGLHGIENEIEPPHICEGNAYEDARYPRLPHSLQDATQALKASSFAREAFGERFVDHYVLSREEELRLWDEWQRGQVSAWEYKRYFETI